MYLEYSDWNCRMCNEKLDPETFHEILSLESQVKIAAATDMSQVKLATLLQNCKFHLLN